MPGNVAPESGILTAVSFDVAHPPRVSLSSFIDIATNCKFCTSGAFSNNAACSFCLSGVLIALHLTFAQILTVAVNFKSFCILSFAINYLFDLGVSLLNRRMCKLLHLNFLPLHALGFHCTWVHIHCCHCCRKSELRNFFPPPIPIVDPFSPQAILVAAAGNCGKI